RSNQPGEMRDHLVGDTPRITPDTRGVKTNGAMEPLVPAHPVLALGSTWTARRNRLPPSANRTAGRLIGLAWTRCRLGLVLLECHLGADQEARKIVFRDIHQFAATQTAVASCSVVEAF